MTTANGGTVVVEYSADTKAFQAGVQQLITSSSRVDATLLRMASEARINANNTIAAALDESRAVIAIAQAAEKHGSFGARSFGGMADAARLVDDKMGKLQVTIGGMSQALGASGGAIGNVVGGFADLGLAFASGGLLMAGIAAVGAAAAWVIGEIAKADAAAKQITEAAAARLKSSFDDVKAAMVSLESLQTGQSAASITRAQQVDAARLDVSKAQAALDDIAIGSAESVRAMAGTGVKANAAAAALDTLEVATMTLANLESAMAVETATTTLALEIAEQSKAVDAANAAEAEYQAALKAAGDALRSRRTDSKYHALMQKLDSVGTGGYTAEFESTLMATVDVADGLADSFTVLDDATLEHAQSQATAALNAANAMDQMSAAARSSAAAERDRVESIGVAGVDGLLSGGIGGMISGIASSIDPMVGKMVNAVTAVVGQIKDAVIGAVAMLGDARLTAASEQGIGGAAAGSAMGLLGLLLGALVLTSLPGLILLGLVLSPLIVLVSLIVGQLALLLAVLVAVTLYVASVPAMIGGVAAFGLAISTSTKSFAELQRGASIIVDRIVRVLEPLWQAMHPLLGIGMLMVDAVMPLFSSLAGGTAVQEVLFNVARQLAAIFIDVAYVSAGLINMFVSLGVFIAELTGQDASGIEGHRIGQGSFDRMNAMSDRLDNTTYEQAADLASALLANTDATRSNTDAFVGRENLPAWVRVERYEDSALRGSSSSFTPQTVLNGTINVTGSSSQMWQQLARNQARQGRNGRGGNNGNNDQSNNG